MIDALITSKTRVKLLVKFFLNPAMSAYLRELAKEFDESTNAVRIELNRLTEAGLLEIENKGNKVYYKASHRHPLFPEIKSLVSKYMGLDKIVDQVISYLGDVHKAYLIGDYAAGNDSGLIEIILVGNIKQAYLDNLIVRVKQEIDRDFRCTVMTDEACRQFFETEYKGKYLLLWSKQ
jgi:DNA-binding transcriptional ArsR family regulator